MIVSKINSVYKFTLPSEVRTFLSGIDIAISLGLEEAIAGLSCVGLTGYLPQLTFWMLVPPAILAVMIIGAVAVSCYQREAITLGGLGLKIAPLGIKILFVLYPVITNVHPAGLELLAVWHFPPLSCLS